MNRRDWLKAILAAGVGASTFGATAGQMRLLSNVAQQTRFSDYKALICIFLYGGNDSYNMLVPTDASDHATYAAVRQNLAIPQESLLSLQTSSALPYALGVPNYMEKLADLYAAQQLIWVNNVGSLEEPASKSQIRQNQVQLPPQLFSHNDQQKIWERASNNLIGLSGWAGRVADLWHDVNPNSVLPLNISLAGNNVLQTGEQVSPYGITADGADMFAGLDPRHSWNERRIAVFEQLIATEQHKLGGAYRQIINRARTNASVVNNALSSLPSSNSPFNDNRFENELAMVVKMIQARSELSMQRQVFFVGLGGWDTHDRQLEAHPELLTTLADGLANLNSALTELNLNSQVTTFTMSEFGRTLTSNGDGTDHGWGGHQMVMGGAVRGGQFYGQMPSLELNSEDDFGEGRIIPTTASEQYSATLAKWFGLSESEIALVFPNVNRFSTTDLGFLNMKS